MALNELTRRLVERHCERYCRPVCPPRFARQVRLGFRIENDDVWLHEIKPIFRTFGMHATREMPLARFRHSPSSGTWRFHCVDGRGCLRPYSPLPRARDFVRLLREFDLDPYGVFWDRVNGASLRWCSAKGRCPDCDARYSQIVGCELTTGSHVTDAGSPDVAPMSRRAR